ncbi:MAG: PKD domain-containing protein [Paludibacteraceae bacterium]|nr:PKD domain-containing protein [Paludibacteraceae bacterium]
MLYILVVLSVSGLWGCAPDEPYNLPKGESAYLHRVLEYCPAPGQFVNVLPEYEAGDDASSMAAKCTAALADNARGTVTLGGWGGYMTFAFDHPIRNIAGERDFSISGNAFTMNGNAAYGSSEPGIVLVSRDVNKNGMADDEWYELAGSEYASPETEHFYTYTYTRAGDTVRNAFHKQPYYPEWYGDSCTFTGSLLAVHQERVSNQYVVRTPDYGYADNKPNTDTTGIGMDIGWAVDAGGRSVSLPYIDFVRVYTAVQDCNDITGELSTEITGAEDLHWRN